MLAKPWQRDVAEIGVELRRKLDGLQRDVAALTDNVKRALAYSGPAKRNDFISVKDQKMNHYERTEKENQLAEQVQRVQQKYSGKSMPQNVVDWLDEAQQVLQDADDRRPHRPVTLQSSFGVNHSTRTTGAPYALRSPGASKDYKSLFGSAGHSWQGKSDSDNFFAAVFSGRHDPRLIKAGMSTTVPSDGGFLVPSELAAMIHAVSLETEVVAPLAYMQPMMSNTLQVPAMSIGDHGVSLFGGFQASYTAEGGTLTEKNPTVRQMELQAKKLTGRLKMSNELAADMQGGPEQIIRICGEGLAWYRDRAFLKGSGAGQPLGVLNAPCTITVAAESGQGANTIVYANLVKMLARLHAASFSRSVWVCHQSTIPQLLQLFVTRTDGTDTFGNHLPVLRETGDGFKLLTRPVIFTEKTETLGTRGDIMLCDFSQYVVGLREGMRFDLSQHVHFDQDQLAARLIERHDGQPLWDSALTLEDGTTTVSPFIALATDRT